LADAEQQSGNKLKILHTDGGGEYFSSDFIKYLKDAGIVHEKTNPNTPQENGVAKRVNRTLVTMTIAMLESVKSLVRWTAWPYDMLPISKMLSHIHHSQMASHPMSCGQEISHLSPPYAPLAAKPLLPSLRTNGTNLQAIL
jgi:transposase InsO family protein